MPNSRTVLQRGASTVELALVVPLLMGVAWGFVRVGNLLTQVYVAQQASYSAVLLGAEINADAETGLGLIQSRAELVVGHSANNMIPGNGDRYFEPSYVVNTEARLVEVDLVARVKDAAEATLPAALAQKLVAPLLTPRTVLDPTYEFQNGLGHYDCEGVWIGDSPLAQTCCNGGCSEDQGGSGSGDYGSNGGDGGDDYGGGSQGGSGDGDGGDDYGSGSDAPPAIETPSPTPTAAPGVTPTATPQPTIQPTPDPGFGGGEGGWDFTPEGMIRGGR